MIRRMVKRLVESNHLPEGVSLENDSLRLSETVVVGGNWYWKSKGKCWTQPTDKSSPRKEISEDEYREVCAKAKEEEPKSADSSRSDLNKYQEFSQKSAEVAELRKAVRDEEKRTYKELSELGAKYGMTPPDESSARYGDTIEIEKPLDNESTSAVISGIEGMGYKRSEEKNLSGGAKYLRFKSSDGRRLSLRTGPYYAYIEMDTTDSKLNKKFSKSIKDMDNVSREYMKNVDWSSKEFKSSGDAKDFKDRPTITFKTSASAGRNREYLVNDQGQICSVVTGVGIDPIYEPVSDKVLSNIKDKILAGKY